jgi:hypothetical protein
VQNSRDLEVEERREVLEIQEECPPVTSTPLVMTATTMRAIAAESPIQREERVVRLERRGETRQFRFERRVRNPKRKRLVFEEPSHEPIPDEPPTKKMSWQWQAREPRVFKFIDDGTITSKINMHNAEIEPLVPKPSYVKRDLATEMVFNRTVARAESKGMKLNLSKTNMLIISQANSYEPVGYIQTEEGRLESSRKTVRILGFMFHACRRDC